MVLAVLSLFAAKTTLYKLREENNDDRSKNTHNQANQLRGGGNFPAIKISIMLHMYKHGACLVQEVVELMETSRPSAQRHLTSLVVAGMATKKEVYEQCKYKNKFALTAEAKKLIEKNLNILN